MSYPSGARVTVITTLSTDRGEFQISRKLGESVVELVLHSELTGEEVDLAVSHDGFVIFLRKLLEELEKEVNYEA